MRRSFPYLVSLPRNRSRIVVFVGDKASNYVSNHFLDQKSSPRSLPIPKAFSTSSRSQHPSQRPQIKFNGRNKRESVVSLKEQVRQLSEVTEKLMHPFGQLKKKKGRLTLDSILKQWDTLLKQLEKDTSLLKHSVEIVDRLVRAILKEPNTSEAGYALYVGLSGWARVPDDQASAFRAEEIFRLLQYRWNGVPKDLRRTVARGRRDQYHALLLAWSRSKNPLAPERASYWLQHMKLEERTNNVTLVDADCYNRVMGAYATQGKVDHIHKLWKEMEAEPSIGANYVTYDCLVRAYQERSQQWQNVTDAVADAAWAVLEDQMQAYRSSGSSPDLKPSALTLGRVLSIYQYHPQRTREILEQALAFQKEQQPDCCDFVDDRAFLLVMTAFGRAGRVKESEALLQWMVQLYEEGNDRLKPTSKIFTAILHGLLKSNPPQSLNKAEELLRAMEERFLTEGSSTDGMDCTPYNVLMSGYQQSANDDAIQSIEQTMEHMEALAKKSGKKELLPDRSSYSILMQAIIKRGDPGYEKKVEAVLEMMETGGGRSAQPDVRTYAMVLHAWAKSGNSLAIDRAESIFQRIQQPDATCFNTLMNIYARRGDAEKTQSLMHQMRTEFESGRNSNCKPDKVTYSTAIKAWRHSPNPQRWDRAFHLFEDMILRYQNGEIDCRPSEQTMGSLLHLLASSVEPAAKHRVAQGLMDRLDDIELRQSPAVATAFILACGETTGDDDTRQDALQCALRTLYGIGSDATHDEYNAMLKACHKLIKDSHERNKAFEEVFRRCADHGQVSYQVLSTLGKLSPADIYLTLTLQSDRKEPSMDLIPQEWKRNLLNHTR